ncbi:uncharacterized protein I206_103175 [Kwoniella pini CBS 10737]|uniref:Uncharacterized protein n=1 Tax=Kwoniella pini CBS 10737 TaxID=1296096 RepID=A0AAJ8L473_9TREE
MESIGIGGSKEVRIWLMRYLRSYDPAWFLASTFSSVPIETCKKLVQLPFFVRRFVLPVRIWIYAPYPENLTFGGTA